MSSEIGIFSGWPYVAVVLENTNRQTPTIWAEKSRDVLVGNFPSIAFRDPGLKEIWLNDAKNKDSAAYASLLTVLSYGAAQAGDIRQSVELMRTLDALGEATPFTHLFLGVLLLSTGREQEAEQQFARVMSSGDSYDRDQAILLSRKPTLKRQDRADAAIRIWRTTKEAIDVERMMSLQLSDSRSSLWKEVFDGVAIGSRKHSFLSALKLQLEDKPAEALQTIKGASDQPGDDPPLSAILGLQFECAQKVGDVLLARKTIVQALDQPRDLNLWLYRYLTIAQGDPLESKVAVAKAVIDLATAPVLVSRAVLFVPEAAQELESNLRAASERLPFSPEILLCTWAIQYSQAWDLPITFPEVLARESDSEAFLTWNAWRLLLEIYQAQLRAGTLRSPKAGLVNDALIELTSRYPSELRQRPLDYMMMVVVYAPSGRASQLGFMQRRFLLDKFVQSEADPRFRAVGLYSACLAGDLTTARAIFADGKWAGAQVASFTVVYATSLAMAGFEEEAKAALSFVLAFEGSAVADEKASLLYYLGLEGLKKEPQSTNGKVLAGLARAKRLLSLKDVPKQDLQAGFQDAVAIQKLALSTSRSDLRAKALATVTDFRIKLDETQGAASDPLLSDPLSLEGHRSFADLPWMTPTQIADCVGDFVFQGKMRWDGEEAKPVKLELRVGSDGNWTGEIKGGEYRLKMTGSVNRYGYLLGKSEEGHELQGRLLPRTIGTPIARVTLWSPLGRQASVTNLSLIAPGN
ncbi:MAG: hypothetical protein MUC92_02275 [Fimbriimonadaceae bacterium]|nr:hypothetical protein [Fimbriimonadaceae bacterium]